MKLTQLRFLIFFIALPCLSAHGAGIESYQYQETVGGVEKNIQWCLNKSEPIRLLYQSKTETHMTTTDASSATLQWDMERETEGTSLHARRQPRKIIIQGVWKGRQIDKALSVDDAPWYQATSWSLRDFVLSSRKEIRFWTVRIDTLTVHKIKAVKKRPATLNLNGINEEAVEVELRLEGLMSLFWKSSYWFRRSDGVFLRFNGPSGPPGSPAIVVEYRGLADPCRLDAMVKRPSRTSVVSRK